MPLTAILYHGWGFDGGIWAGMAKNLPDWRLLAQDRGYFGSPRMPVPEGPCIAVTHSFGTMLALHEPPPGCIGILAINGFDRFTANPETAGVQGRIVERMIVRFEREPETVLREFRDRCGCAAPFVIGDASRLEQDLRLLAEMDCTRQAAETALPILLLQGDADPILPPAMRQTVFGGAKRLERRTLSGGHLLPLGAPEICAGMLREFAEGLA